MFGIPVPIYCLDKHHNADHFASFASVDNFSAYMYIDWPDKAERTSELICTASLLHSSFYIYEGVRWVNFSNPFKVGHSTCICRGKVGRFFKSIQSTVVPATNDHLFCEAKMIAYGRWCFMAGKLTKK